MTEANSASITLTKLQNPVKNGFDHVTESLKKVYAGYNKYGKALDKVSVQCLLRLLCLPENKTNGGLAQQNFPSKALPTEYDALAAYPELINRAIVMHLLREGQFHVASTFLEEAHNIPLPATPMPDPLKHHADGDLEYPSLKSQELQIQFAHMYTILHELRNKGLSLAIAWARENSEKLEMRGSNLEFELHRLQYIWLFLGAQVNGLPDDENNGLLGALKYAKLHFPRFQTRFLREIKALSTGMAFASNLRESPYGRTFETGTAWEEVANSFTREFCSLLGLSSESPLYVAVTAGAISLPTLMKLATIMKEKRTEWTTQNELPVEIPLPKSMTFHAIFVCPVSKEQTTESNPPMMIPCGHVIAKESLQRLSKGQRFKCPYCPNESWPKEAREVYL
jgi:hypothetical protein